MWTWVCVSGQLCFFFLIDTCFFFFSFPLFFYLAALGLSCSMWGL